jgi:hypothetical protein
MLVSGMSIIDRPRMMMVVLVMLLGVVASVHGQQQQSCSSIRSPLVCTKIGGDNDGGGTTSSSRLLPQLDADLSDWTTDDANNNNGTTILVAPVYHAIRAEEYDDGQVTIQCRYSSGGSTTTGDESGVGQIYLAIQVPGLYRFNAEDDHQCAAIGAMMKMGPDATFVNMGGCPDAGSCDASVPAACDSYRVDILHWQLSGTTPGTLYGTNSGEGTGDDVVANKDDEYAVGPSCRFDDDGNMAANEWSGAWTHTNPVDGEPGTYIFEVSRSLTTASTDTDAQLQPGGTYSFGIAFWDPYETAEGWTDSGHYVTGCGTDWFELQLLDDDEATDDSSTGAFLNDNNNAVGATTPATVSPPSPNVVVPVVLSPNLAPAPSPNVAPDGGDGRTSGGRGPTEAISATPQPTVPSLNLASARSPNLAPAPSPNLASNTAAAPRYFVALSALAVMVLMTATHF